MFVLAAECHILKLSGSRRLVPQRNKKQFLHKVPDRKPPSVACKANKYNIKSCSGGLKASRFAATGASKRYDAIIVGGGHNGLTASAYLAAKGLNVLVLERRHLVGGAAVTEEIIEGFKFSRASYLAGLLRPSVIHDLELKKHGLEFIPRNSSSFTPTLMNDSEYSGKSLILGPNMKNNYESIKQFSEKDAEVYEAYEDMLSNVRDFITPVLDAPLPDIVSHNTWKEWQRLFSLLAKLGPEASPATIQRTAELFLSPISNILDKWFETDILKTTLATDSVIGAMISPNQVGSGYVLLHHVMGEIEGNKGSWAYVRGGMGEISNAIASSAKERGVEIECSANVEEIITVNNQVTGVRMTDGTVIESEIVIAGCTPYHTFMELIPSMSQTHKAFTSDIAHQDQTCGVFKINVAIDKLPSFSCLPNTSEHYKLGGGPQHHGTIHFESRMSEILDAYRDASVGIPAKRPVIEMTIPSSLDHTLAPVKEKGHHVAQLFVQYAPYDISPQVGSWANPSFKKEFVERVFSIVDEFAPGFSDSIIGVDAISPLDLEHEFGLHKGNIFHGSLGLHQIGPLRNRHRTPVKGLYLAGAGVHPAGGVNAACGKNCATIVKDDLRL